MRPHWSFFCLFRLEAERLAAECNMRPRWTFCWSGWRLRGWQLSTTWGHAEPFTDQAGGWEAGSWVQHETTLNLLLIRLEAERLEAKNNMRPRWTIYWSGWRLRGWKLRTTWGHAEPLFDCSGWRLRGWQLSAIWGCTGPPLKRTSTWAASSNT